VVELESDRTLRALRDAVPRGWRVYSQQDRVIIERDDLVWVLSENRISAPAMTESDAERVARIQRHGTRVHPRIVYRAEAGWTADTLRAAREHNEKVYREIFALPDRHGVRRLVEATRSRKNPDPKIGATPDELPRVEAYLKERAELEKRVRPLPRYLTERYALFGPDYEGWSDAYHIVHPYPVAEECYRLDDKLRELLKTNGK